MPTEESYPRLISLAVHELRTPASVVGGYLRMLQRDPQPLAERHRKMVDEAERSCARLVALIGELSEVGKLDERLITMAQRQTDLFRLVGEVAEGMHEAAERNVVLEVRGPEDGALVAADPERLRSAFSAIFRAILREKPGPCTVVVDRRLVPTPDGTSAVVVAGEADFVHLAYDVPAGPFDEKRGGLGLALPIARRVIEAHGGRLWSPAAGGAGGKAGGLDERTARSTVIAALPLGS